MKRSFAVDEWHMRADDDGRTVEGRIVPYLEPTEVIERDHVTGELKRFREQFLPRSCLAMAQAMRTRGNAGFIAFLMDHEEHDFDAKIGYAASLEDRDNGAHAVFRLYQSRDIEKVTSMLNESHRGLSINFADRKPPRMIDGIVSRVQVHIDHVAATPTPCYASASITGMRSVDELREIEASLPAATPNLDAVREWLEELRKVPT